MKLNRFLLIVLFIVLRICFQTKAQQVEKLTAPIHISLKDISPPDIHFLYKANGVLNSQGKVDVKIIVRDFSGLKSVSINREAQALGVVKDSLMLLKSYSPDQEIVIEASDRFNNVKEKSFVVHGQGHAVVTLGTKVIHQNYLLLIAEEQYSDPAIAPLTEPIKDAMLLKKVLMEKYTFDEQFVTFLKNPTFEEIEIEFEKLGRVITPDDNLVVFYAGHGYFDQKSNVGYWLPSDAQKKNHARWFRNSALVEDIGAINSKHTLLIADACFSGGIFKTRAAFNNASEDIANMLKRPSRKAMTSGSLTTVPDKSIFMKYLLKALEENENYYLPSEDLFDDVRVSMRNNADSKPLYGEIKDVGDEGGNLVFISRVNVKK